MSDCTVIVRPGMPMVHRFLTSFGLRHTTIACSCGWHGVLPRGCTTTERHAMISRHLLEARTREAFERKAQQEKVLQP